VAAAVDPESQLAWERRQRPRAGVAALVGGAFTFASYIGAGLVFSDVPRSYYLSSLERAVRPGALGGLPSLQQPVFRFLDDRMPTLLLLGVVSLIGALGLGWALGFLAVATRARRPALGRFAVYVPIVGGALLGLSGLLQAVGRVIVAHDFLTGPNTVDRATGGLNTAVLATSSYVGLLAGLLVAVAFVLICLNAMRAGLLSRFMGVLGVIVGVLVIFPLGGPVVESFWLLALGALLLGQWPPGVPPAWRTGREEPWPSQQELAEQRRARAGGRPSAEPEPEPAAAPPAPAASATRRKRKRRT
jgi:hypothetical protein